MLDAEEMDRRVKRHYSFWRERFEGEGAYIAITAPDETALSRFPKLKSPESLEQRWFDIDYRIKSANYKVDTTYFAGDAVPTIFVDFGPGALAGFLGCGYRLAENTIWFDNEPLMHNYENIPEFKLQTNNKFYKTFKEATKMFCEDSYGKYFPSIPDMGTNLDILASIRGTDNLLIDLIRKPDKVKNLLVKIDKLWADAVDENISIIRQYKLPVTSWVPILNNKKWYPLLSEFSAMISPSLFQDITFPVLQRELEYLDQGLFDLDGEDQIKFLPIILELKGLHSVMWNPVPKFNAKLNKVIKDFASEASIDVYRKLQTAGKKIVINGVMPEQVVKILDYISPDGVFFIVNCESRKDAEEFLTFSRKWIKKI